MDIHMVVAVDILAVCPPKLKVIGFNKIATISRKWYMLCVLFKSMDFVVAVVNVCHSLEEQ